MRPGLPLLIWPHEILNVFSVHLFLSSSVQSPAREMLAKVQILDIADWLGASVSAALQALG